MSLGNLAMKAQQAASAIRDVAKAADVATAASGHFTAAQEKILDNIRKMVAGSVTGAAKIEEFEYAIEQLNSAYKRNDAIAIQSWTNQINAISEFIRRMHWDNTFDPTQFVATYNNPSKDPFGKMGGGSGGGSGSTTTRGVRLGRSPRGTSPQNTAGGQNPGSTTKAKATGQLRS